MKRLPKSSFDRLQAVVNDPLLWTVIAFDPDLIYDYECVPDDEYWIISGPVGGSPEPATEAAQEIIVHSFGLDDAASEALFDRVAEAAHALDEEVFCSGGPVRSVPGEKP